MVELDIRRIRQSGGGHWPGAGTHEGSLYGNGHDELKHIYCFNNPIIVHACASRMISP